MKTHVTKTFLTLAFFGLVTTAASAQFTIKIPKISKPKTEPVDTRPVERESANQPVTRGTTSANTTRSGAIYAVKPEAPTNPQFLSEALEVQIERWDYYWKIPNDNHNSSWVPRIVAKAFYGGSANLRYKAEYTMPDGTIWFSEPLEYRGNFASDGTASLMSESDSNRDKKSIVTGGLFGIKITDTKDSSTVFQGKFKVVRYKPKSSDARYKNEVDYYVDYDWKLPIGIADIDWSSRNAVPIIRMWFKGDLKTSGFEARLFHKGQQIATTDDGGSVGSGERYYAFQRGDDDSLFWNEFRFRWPERAEFLVTGDLSNYTTPEQFINQRPGEYVVKVYYNGDQVRETNFSIGSNGTYADNGIAKQSKISTNKSILPVKVMGTLDKWNPANAKTMGFYGTPVAVSNVP